MGSYCEMAEWEKRSQGKNYCASLRWSAVAKDDDYDDSSDGDGDVNSNVCKCRVLEGIIVAHVAIFFLRHGTRGS